MGGRASGAQTDTWVLQRLQPALACLALLGCDTLLTLKRAVDACVPIKRLN